ncbi:MAG TPA: phosphotransferase [Patescibacteria group bacterium]|nr:phosphotransferase [Patescibacteria group bacterium]
MDQEVIARALQAYGVAYVRELGMQKGYRNESHAIEQADGMRLNLIIYKREPGMLKRVHNANRVSNYLASAGFPARRTADERILQLKSGDFVKYASLYKYLPGKTIPWEAYTMEHIKLLGQTMSDMHATLAGLNRGGLPHVADEYLAILDRMERYFAEPGVQTAMQKKLGLTVDTSAVPKLKTLLRKIKSLPDQQVLHMDFVRGNILFETSEIKAEKPAVSGLLDFEKTSFGPPVFDIARTLAFLLVDCKYKEPEKVRKYFLQSGYNKRGNATFQDVRIKDNDETLLDSLVELFLLHDFYKFLRHNPYESLPDNEHFVRTKNIVTVLA